MLAEYSDEGVDAPAPPLPRSAEFVATRRRSRGRGHRRPRRDPRRAPADRTVDHIIERARRVVAVEGDGRRSRCRARRATGGRLARITPSLAMAWLAWAGASGGAHGRRRGAAIGRFGAWWTVAALTDAADAWPVEPDVIGELVASLQWYWWDAGEPRLGWELQLAAADPAEGYAWAISAHDSA